MIDAVNIDKNSSIFEIGCGDGALTSHLIHTDAQRVWVFEIDPEWSRFVLNEYPSPKISMFTENILDVREERFVEHAPWILLANLPYQVTFPILYKLQQWKSLLQEGVIMVQEEVAQKIVQQRGRGYGYSSLFFQHHFQWTLLEKVPPQAFIPPPKVFSRLLHFRPRIDAPVIAHEVEFWKFIKLIFKQPRRTIRNNLLQTQYPFERLSEQTLALRAQQMGMDDLLALWDVLKTDE
jgi:16S rRNA (adenine1518-N6/adenine1519-N6)-dimethyltransferase